MLILRGKPVRTELLRKRLRGGRQVGIDRSERKVDALRYTYNTRMAIAVKHDVLREWIGHRSKAMHYLTPDVEDRLAEYQQYSKEVDGFWG